ncbi:MAG TPA: SRPBCC family protein [Rhodanobacteraceae bacterium]|nr:SRPBCC family protein [Rhodanobacteraceae bacterium]
MNEPGPGDRIEQAALIHAPRRDVWRALADAEAFGTWFGVDLAGKRFMPGQSVSGHLTPAGYQHLLWEVVIERIEPERLLSFRWHPYAIDPTVDYSAEPTTLVTFSLADENGGGTRLRISEAGFDAIPAARREEAWRMNREGWRIQAGNLAGYIGGRQQHPPGS